MLAVESLTKRYPGGRGILDVSLRAAAGEVVALIGPSGCGKSTLLRVVAGLVTADSGRVLLRDQDVTSLPPERRKVGLIFQNYALFPHLSVFDNVAYGLRARGADKAAIAGAVARALEMVDLAGRDGKIDQLSGGEQQRVAVARAVVTEPDALLLDEPLSNLDPNLRQRMRLSLRGILKRLSIPSIHVTHDQEEALAISDEVAVLDAGRLAQVGPPEEIYRRPRSAFVARFIGAANVVRGRVVRASAAGVQVTALGGAALEGTGDGPFSPGDAVDLALRPETLAIGRLTTPPAFDATVSDRVFLGATVELRCTAGGETLVVRVPSQSPGAGASPGDCVRLSVDPAHVHVMPATR